jgi:uncharacterized membrane protein
MRLLLAAALFGLAGLSFGLTFGVALGALCAVIAAVLGLALAQSDQLPMSAWLGALIPIAMLPDHAIGEPSVLRAGLCVALMALCWAWAAVPIERLEARRWGPWLLGALAAYWALASGLSALKYAHFGDILARDAAYYDQIFRSAVLGDGVWRGSILQGLYHDPPLTAHWGVHVTPVAWLLWPIYWLWPRLEALLLARNALLLLSAWPMYLLARRRLGQLPSALVAAALLATPTLLYQPLNSFYFYPAAVAPFLFAWYFHEEDRPLGFVGACAALLLVREDMGIAVASLGALSLWERWGLREATWRWRLGAAARAAMAPVGIAWWLGMVTQVMPQHGAAAGAATLSWYAGWGGGAGKILQEPGFLVAVLFSELKLNYLWQLLRSSGGLGALALPGALGLPYLAINLLVTRPQAATAQITYHYSLLIVAAMYLAVPRVLEAWTRDSPPMARLARQGALAMFVLAMSLSSLTLVFSRQELGVLWGGPEVALFERLLAQIPADGASVAAPSRMLPALTAAHPVLVASDKPMGYASIDMDWVLLGEGEGTYYPGDWSAAQWRGLFERFAADPRYELVLREGGYALYRRR